MLPRRMKYAVHVVGSPAWVRCQSVYLLRVQLAHTCCEQYYPEVVDNMVLSKHLSLLVSLVDQHTVLAEYNRYRRRSRSLVATGTNPRNSHPSTTAVAGPFQRTKPGGDAARAPPPETEAGHKPPEPNPDESAEGQEDAHSGPNAGAGGGAGRGQGGLGLHNRMHLDPGLVRNTIYEVVGTEPFNDHFVGRTLIDRKTSGKGSKDNHTTASSLIDLALSIVAMDWYDRFGVPLPYHTGTVHGTSLRWAMLFPDLARCVCGRESVRNAASCIPTASRPWCSRTSARSAAPRPRQRCLPPDRTMQIKTGLMPRHVINPHLSWCHRNRCLRHHHYLHGMNAMCLPTAAAGRKASRSPPCSIW